MGLKQRKKPQTIHQYKRQDSLFIRVDKSFSCSYMCVWDEHECPSAFYLSIQLHTVKSNASRFPNG